MQDKEDFVKIGQLRKTRKPHVLKGTIKIKELDLEIEVIGLIRSEHQKTKSNSSDLEIFIIQKNNNPFKNE